MYHHTSRSSVRNEVFNAVSHGVGAVASLGFLLAVLVTRGDNTVLWGAVIFSLSAFLLYLMSTLYHSLYFTRAAGIFRVLDHSAIYILIAGTYTPFALTTLKNSSGLWLLGLVWGMAIGGIIFKSTCTGKYRVLSTLLYIAMGWLALLVITDLRSGLGWPFWLLLAGGVAYTAGTLFYGWKKIPYNHGIWHLFVLGGTICHAVAVGALYF